MPADAPTAFFSYSRDDSDFALRLAQDLREGGASVWIDQLDIEPGQAWDSAVEDAVTRCQRMVVILSPISVKSTNVRNEIAFALDEKKIIIPVLYQDCLVPLQLRRIQHTDFRTDYARSLKILLKTLGVAPQAAAAAAATVANEGKGAADEAMLEEERRQAATEKSRLEQEKEAAQAQLEQEQKRSMERLQREREEAAEHARVPAPVPAPAQWDQRPAARRSPLPGLWEIPLWARIAVPACVILVVAFVLYILYWATRPKQGQVAAPTTAVETQPYSPPPAAEVSPGSGAAEKGAEVKQPATESLSAQAMNEKGSDYYYGRNGVSKDYKQAVSWFRKGAEAGNRLALWNLGFMYSHGYGVKKDDKQAASWYRKAAEAGDAAAMTSLGFMYYNGYGVSKDDRQSFSWYRKAAEAGDTEGMANLALAYERGEGVDKDYDRAIAWYRKAAEAGNGQGMGGLGSMYYNGYGVEKDYQQAFYWCRKAAEAGNATGMGNLGFLYENGYGVEKDQQQAISWYRKAAQLGNEWAKDQLKRLGVSP